jgi:hypothetical protein
MAAKSFLSRERCRRNSVLHKTTVRTFSLDGDWHGISLRKISKMALCFLRVVRRTAMGRCRAV